MSLHRILSLSLLTAAASLAGCANVVSDAPRLDGAFGSTVKGAIALQTANPNAGRTAKVGSTFDGQAAVAAIGEYRDSFKAPPPSFTVLGIGGGIAASK